MSTLEALKHRN